MSTDWIPVDKVLIFRVLFVSGLDVDGIYRVSGNLSSINKLRGLIDNGKFLKIPLPS